MNQIIEKLESYLVFVREKRKGYEKEFYAKKQFTSPQFDKLEHYYEKEINCAEAIKYIKKL